ncbi:hypothetical protein J3R82DRAFT_12050 [Butyriboletus roseoflavus]|nr:hypothetical protein J3R82DRAFT_12050 [Butyriboletus roseoflavus]
MFAQLRVQCVAKRRFNSPDGKIPEIPHIIVCPVNLKDQWDREIKRFLKPATFDIFPYTGRFDTRTTWWTAFYSKSHQKQSRRLILATYTAVQDDSIRCFRSGSKNDQGRGLKIAQYQRNAPHTVYGHEFGFMIMDEAHAGRKYNTAHVACRELRIKSRVIIALTATPVTTKAQDLWIMGDLLGIKGFDDHDELVKMTRELNAASRKDAKEQREAGYEGNQLRGTLIGKVNPNVPAAEFAPKMRQWMKVMRERFSTHIIQRTIDSKDPRGQKLFGMRPYQDHSLHLRMYEWEMENLRSFAKEIVKDNPMAAAADTRKHFYIEFRRSMLHPRLNPKFADYWKKPETLQYWLDSEEKTIKLDILAQVVKHHLTMGGVAPLTTKADGKTLEVNTEFKADTHPYSECDRIVVYSAFPSSNAAIFDIFQLYGILATELNGSMSLKKRSEALNAFRTSTTTQGPRVLILSSVGLVGLNLACANIMVLVDTTWSALDDEQLRGRIFRYPQQKQVHIYCLIALGTPDVFLNNISFDKGQLHSAFIGTDPVFREMFVPQVDDDDLISVASSDLPSGTKTKETVDPAAKGKGRAKGKGTAKGKGKSKAQDDHVGDTGVEHAKQANETTKTNAPATSKVAGSSNRKAKGKVISKAIITDEDDMQDSAAEPAPEPTSRNKQGSKKSRLRSPQPGSKRRQSVISPLTSPGEKGQKRSRAKQRPAEVDETDSASIGLVQAASHLHIDDHSLMATGGTTMRDAISDPFLASMLAPGGQNDPDQDEDAAMSSLRTSPPAPSQPDPISSPLTELGPPSDNIQPDDIMDTTYTLHHRPARGTSTRIAQVAAPPPPLPLIGGLHGGSLAKNRDGSGNSRGKMPRSKRGGK